mgnify:CR=1 FL=1
MVTLLADKDVSALSYIIKPMVAARLLAESLVLLILSLLPISLFVVKELAVADWTLKLILLLLSPLALALLAAAACLPFRVVLSASGIRTVALLRSTSVPWAQVRTVKLASKWGFRVYEVAGDTGTLTFFPLWFKKVKELVEQVRAQVPNRGRTIFAAEHVYQRDTAVLVLQVLKAGGQLIFLAVFWCFFASYRSTSGSRFEDIMVLLGAGTIFSGIAIWKFYLLLTMPDQVIVGRETIVCKGLFGRKVFQRQHITGVQNSNLLQPEGVVLQAGKRSVLIGAVFESFDELEEELRPARVVGKS